MGAVPWQPGDPTMRQAKAAYLGVSFVFLLLSTACWATCYWLLHQSWWPFGVWSHVVLYALAFIDTLDSAYVLYANYVSHRGCRAGGSTSCTVGYAKCLLKEDVWGRTPLSIPFWLFVMPAGVLNLVYRQWVERRAGRWLHESWSTGKMPDWDPDPIKSFKKQWLRKQPQT